MPKVSISVDGDECIVSFENNELKINGVVITPIDNSTEKTDRIREAEEIIDETTPERRRWLLALFFAPHIDLIENTPALSIIDEVAIRLVNGKEVPPIITINESRIVKGNKTYRIPTTGSEMMTFNAKKLLLKICK
jgi:hypothetical protein